MKTFQKALQSLTINQTLFNVITIIIILLLPYYFFEGKLFIGGDDTRLLYVYPYQFLKEWSYFSWTNVSSLSYNNPAQLYIPFLLFWSAIDFVVGSKIIISYLAFSLPMILGLLYFQKLLREFLGKEAFYEIFIGSLFYILSPILIVNQYAVFLTAVWSIVLFPLFTYYIVKYVKTGEYIYAYKGLLWGIFFSYTFYTFPWLFGFFIPLIAGFLMWLLFYRKVIHVIYLKRLVVFIAPFVMTQMFWLLPFIASFINTRVNNVGSRVMTEEVTNTFAPTVLSTATGTIFYPLLNLFHRQIAIDFEWPLQTIFKSFYDITLPLNIIYIIVLFAGLLFSKTYLASRQKKSYTFFLLAFLFSLFLFTVNIGPLKDIFLLFGAIPGFVMFRNFYDKFAPAYVFFFASVFTFSLSIIKSKFPHWEKRILTIIAILIVVNILPFKTLVSGVLWKTENIYKHVALPDEYLSFLKKISQTIPTSTTIISLPFNEAAYAIVMDEDNTHAYIGTSPMKILTGVNDISGNMSFNTEKGKEFTTYILKRDYDSINKFFQTHNIQYVLVTRNIHPEVMHSYLYDPQKVRVQDEALIRNITSQKVIESSNKNYVLYKTKLSTHLFSPENISFQKVNSTKYVINVKNLTSYQELIFLDSFNSGWNLYLNKESQLSCHIDKERACPERFSFFDGDELTYLWRKPDFQATHQSYEPFGNSWKIDRQTIQNTYSSESYSVNTDGSINLSFVLYFKPQVYFYLGTVISLVSFVAITIYFFYAQRK